MRQVQHAVMSPELDGAVVMLDGTWMKWLDNHPSYLAGEWVYTCAHVDLIL